MDSFEKQKRIFGMLFLLANKLQVIGDRRLSKDGMTTKQWFLSVIISQFGNNPPTLGTVTHMMGSSHQNVKQLAIKLAEKNLLRIEKDPQDARTLRLRLTERSREFWEQREEQDNRFLRDLFSDLSQAETEIMYEGFGKLLAKIAKLENGLSKGRESDD